MRIGSTLRATLLLLIAAAICLAVIGCDETSSADPSTASSTSPSNDTSTGVPTSTTTASNDKPDEESEMGQEVFNELKGKA
jgi:hypothetical protein